MNKIKFAHRRRVGKTSADQKRFLPDKHFGVKIRDSALQNGWFLGNRVAFPKNTVAFSQFCHCMKNWPPLFLFFVITLALPIRGAGQSAVADSLTRLLLTTPPDTHRVSLLTNLAWDIIDGQTREAENHFLEAITLAQKLGFSQGEATAWNGLGAVEEVRGNPALAIGHYRKALIMRQALGDQAGIAALHNNLANVYESLGQFEAALQAHRESLTLVEQLRDTVRIARAHLNLGGVFEEMGAYPEAYEQVNTARFFFETRHDVASMARAYTLLGHIRFELEMHSEARLWYGKALNLREQMADSVQMANALSDLANVLDEMGSVDSSRLAVTLYRQALDIRRKIDDEPGLAALYNNLGAAFKHLGQYATALGYLRQALELRTKQDNQPGLMEVYNTYGDVTYRQGNYQEALHYTELYFVIAQAIGDGKFVQKAYKDFAKIYADLGNYTQAYTYRVKYDELRYERLNEARAQDFERKDVLFSDQKRAAEIVRQLHRLELQGADLARAQTRTYALVGGVLGTFLLALLLFNSNRLRARTNRELASKNETIEQERARADRLLKNILPEKTATELILHNTVQPVRYESVTVLFSDFVGFTTIAERVSPEELIAELDRCFRLFDAIMDKHGLEKIKTIGDAYMCAGGLPTPTETHATQIVQAAIEMQKGLRELMQHRPNPDTPVFEMRIGIHTGPVVAGVVGSHKFAYDIWGDTVNTAARLEAGSAAGKINISATTYEQVKHLYTCTFRGNLAAKNKGEIAMYFVEYENL